MRIGWLSTAATGRVQPACRHRAPSTEESIPLDIATVFCDREPGEARGERSLPGLARDELGVTRGHTLQQSELGGGERGRCGRVRGLARQLPPRCDRSVEPPGTGCPGDGRLHARRKPRHVRRYAMLNLHPALPGGPAAPGSRSSGGCSKRRRRDGRDDPPGHRGARPGSGHRVLPFPIAGARWIRSGCSSAKARTLGVGGVAIDEGEVSRCSPRSAAGARRARSLCSTRRCSSSSEGHLNTSCGDVVAVAGDLPLDLTEQVEAELARR